MVWFIIHGVRGLLLLLCVHEDRKNFASRQVRFFFSLAMPFRLVGRYGFCIFAQSSMMTFAKGLCSMDYYQ